MRRLLAATGVLAAVLCGCAVGPTYRAPPTPPAAAGRFDAAAPTAADSVAQPPDRWWALYNDPAIDALVQRALVENTDLRVAAANLAAARASLAQARSFQLPTTQESAGPTYGVSSSSLLLDRLNGEKARPTGGFAANLGASYEVDLFGRIRRGLEAAKGDVQAREAAQDFVRVTVAAETTRAYVDACAYAQEISVGERSLGLTTQSLNIILKQRELGTASDYEVATATTLVEQTRASLAPLRSQRRAALYQLAVLTGQPPEQVDAAAAACKTPPRLASPLPVGDGAGLLRRRPDVREAERNLAAQTARIGVATASLYPTVTLGASAGLFGATPRSVFSSQGLSYSVGPLISWNFPNLLAAKAQVRLAEANATGALAQFDGVVLKALQDTEQALSAYAAELDHHAALAAAQAQASTAYRLAGVRYAQGSTSYLNLITAETTLVQADAALAASDEALASDQISVFKALGGGWQGAPAPAARSQAANVR